MREIDEQDTGRGVETFRRLITDNPFGVYLVDDRFRLRLISRGARKVFENVVPAIDRDFAEVLRIIWPEPFATEAIGRFRHTLETGEPYVAPMTVERRADIETEEAYDWRIDRIDFPGGGYGVVCYFYDLSERQAWEREIADARAIASEQAREISALYAEAPLGLGLIDREFRYVRINAALAEMNGIATEDHIGRIAWDMVPDLRASAEPMLLHVLSTGEPVRDVIVRGRTPGSGDQVREWCEQFYPFRDADGLVTGIGIIAEDVTERHAAARELLAREEELRRVLDQLFAFVGILTPDGHVTYANLAPLDAAGMKLADVVGRHFADTSWWAHDTAVQDRLRAAIASAARGNTVRYDVPVKLGEALVTIDFQIAPLRDRDGAISGLIPSGAIIEERVAAEKALRAMAQSLEGQVKRRTADLEEANRLLRMEISRREAAQAALVQAQKLEALGQLTSGIAHDFNNLLAAITGGLGLIERRTQDEYVRNIVEHSRTAAFRGTKLIKQMLAFARQEVLEPQAVSLAGLAHEIEALIRQAVPGNMVTIDIAADLPPVMVDPTLLEAALLNLAGNAADAMPEGGKLDIRASLNRADDEDRPQSLHGRETIALKVRDSGSGMPPEIVARIIEPFFTTKPRGKGTGLGLAMVHGFVIQSGGDIAIDSAPGKGTTITLYLPTTRSQADGPGPGPAGRADGHIPAGTATILLVDDDEDVRTIVVEQLRSIGHTVTDVGSMADALDLIDRGFHPDLLLTDVVMPGGDGIRLAAEVRSRIPAMPVIFMTGMADSDKLIGETVIYKPFELTRLAHLIEERAANRQGGRAEAG